ncbi:DUF2785 domain-containing protein [Paenisporosarcina sp.]|uniref:DUF2785 domain-containing protein n=1 Tax=Paenisporosarcina sp. TaxID=1932001 RepID=UPI003C78E330
MQTQSIEAPIKVIELKQILKEYLNGEVCWDEKSESHIIEAMMEHIGSTDPELRDKLIYSSFFRLINKLNHEKLIELLELSLSDSFLFKGIGENGTDNVFTRTFTSLLIALILYRDNQDDFLPQRTILKVKDALINYLNEENDLRGHVPDKGWAHSVAHVADAIDELVMNKKCPSEFYQEILEALCRKMFSSASVYINDEDERLITPLMAMIEHGLPVEAVISIIDNLPLKLKEQKEQMNFENYMFLLANTKSFLKSFYIKSIGKTKMLPLQESIVTVLNKI